MFPLNWNIPFIKKNGSRTTLGAITGDIAGIETDIAALNASVNGKLNVIKENNPTWHHTAKITCNLNSAGLAYLFTNAGLVLLTTSSNTIGMRTGLALQSDTNTYFKAEVTGLSADITAWGEAALETSKNALWSLIPINGTWTMTF